MAKKAPTSSKKSTSRSSGRNIQNVRGNKVESSKISKEKKGFLMDLVGNPAFRYVVGGIATAAVAKVATKLAEKYPEIGNFVTDHLNTLESRLSEFKGGEPGGINSADTRYS